MARVIARLLFAAVVVATFGADYVSSWLPSVAGFPGGAIIRDLVAGLLITVGFLAVAVPVGDGGPRDVGPARAALIPIALFAVWAFVLIPVAPGTVPALLAVRNLVIYPAVALAVAALWQRDLISSRTILLTLGCAALTAATLGILDTMTHGRIVELLGYRRDYSGVSGGDSRLIAGTQATFNGIVRASGGISNALVFGYLMSLFAIGAVWWVAARGDVMTRRTTVLIAGLAVLVSVACVASLTRGAWVALIVGEVALVIMNRRRRVVLLAATILLAAGTITVAISPLVPTGQPQAGAAPSPPPGSSQPTDGGGLVGAVTGRANSSDETSQASSGARLDQLRDGLTRLVEVPLGTGLASEGSASERAGAHQQNLVPDLYVLIVGLQAGLPGLVLWLGIFGVLAAWAFHRRGSAGASLVVAMLLAMAVASTLSASPDAPPFSMVFWLLALVMPAIGMRRPADASATPG